MTSYDYGVEVFFVLGGCVAIGLLVFRAVQFLRGDPERQAMAARLGVEGGSRAYRHWSLKVSAPMFKMIAPRVRELKIPLYRKAKKQLFITAGVDDQFDADEFVALKITAALAGPVVVWMFMSQMGKPVTLQWIVIGLAVGFFIPDFVLFDMKKRRQKSILKELPQMMDLLTLSVEAGMDFMAAISRVLEHMREGPLKYELSNVLKEIQLGTTRADALRHMADRVQLSQLSSFSSILIQADEMGSSIGPVLRAQSDLLRNTRFQTAEREGAKATQKLLIPLVIFILPAVFIVILGPVICDIYYNQSWFQDIFK